MAITRATKDADDKLREELAHADIGKFKKAVKRVLAPTKPIRKEKADPPRPKLTGKA